MTDYERGYEQGKADAAKKMHPEIRKCLEDYFGKCFEAYQEEIETYREGILVGPCFCGKWPGGVPPVRHWVGLTKEEIKQACWESGPDGDMSGREDVVRWTEARLKEKNGG
jgi:hypothetical protein